MRHDADRSAGKVAGVRAIPHQAVTIISFSPHSTAQAAGAIEDYHAHLVRLDRKSRFPGMDDRAIEAHCLSLVSRGAILIGAFVDGVMRAAAEIVPGSHLRARPGPLLIKRSRPKVATSNKATSAN